jgi:predicted transposase/invertase (TIGR01784 family)
MDRALYYAAKLLHSHGQKGNWDFNLKAVYVLSILNFDYFDETEADKTSAIEHIYLTRSRNPKWDYRKLRFMMVERPKFTKTLSELETEQDRWIFNLRHLDQLTAQPKELQSNTFNLLFNLAGYSALTKEEQLMYYASLSHENDVRNAIHSEGKRMWNEAVAHMETKYQPVVEENVALKAENERLKNAQNSRNN